MTKSKEPPPLQEATSPSSPETHEGAPTFPPSHPFETYLFERLTTYAQGYLPLPWPHSLTLMDEAVRAELDRSQAERLAEMEEEQAVRESARLAALERNLISWTRLHQWIRAHYG